MEVGKMEQVSYGATAFERRAEEPRSPDGPGAPARYARGRAARGMVSAEWAVGIVAAVAIAGVLLAVVTTGQVKAALLHVILTVIATFATFAK